MSIVENQPIDFQVTDLTKTYHLSVTVGQGAICHTTYDNVDGSAVGKDTISNEPIGQGQSLIGNSIKPITAVASFADDADQIREPTILTACKLFSWLLMLLKIQILPLFRE